ncbi:hypothetical protein EVU91_04530 [Macrococcoides bohemicum]|uniref:hypothetical protein n=1 Tax=Macrococcoides bohemicum TaxID=1903056 RepID=UPI0010593293|nr:hypothetical protein [Macrococcus bohemicus]TDL39415.1 hypothetical protein EVU91_04530 [Macrococcus bohemicus]
MMKIEPVYKFSAVGTYNKYKDIAVIDKSTFVNRMTKGWDIEKALKTPKLYERHPGFYELAEKNGIGIHTYKSRRRYGWSREEAATKPVRPSERKIYDMDGIETVNVIKNIIKEFGTTALSKKQVRFINDNKELFEGMI